MIEKAQGSKFAAAFSGYGGFLIGLTAAGLALILSGALLELGPLSVLLTSAGGAIFGASASLLIGELQQHNLHADVRSIIEKALLPGSHALRLS